MKNFKLTISLLCVMAAAALFCSAATAQINNNPVYGNIVVKTVQYSSVSPSCLLDIAEFDNDKSEMRPAVVIIHGGGWRNGSRQEWVYRGLLSHYASLGYVTLSIDYRLTGEAPFPACVEDVKCAIRWLKAHARELRVDPNRIGTYGHSAGGHLSLMTAVSSGNKDLEKGEWLEYSSDIACCAAGSASVRQRVVGQAGDDPKLWPGGYISANHPPLLILQGIDDSGVRVEITDDYVQKMTAAGADVEYVRIHGNHGVAYEFRLETTLPVMDQFFARHLKK